MYLEGLSICRHLQDCVRMHTRTGNTTDQKISVQVYISLSCIHKNLYLVKKISASPLVQLCFCILAAVICAGIRADLFVYEGKLTYCCEICL